MVLSDRKTSAQKPKHQFVRRIKYQMSVTTVASGMLNRAIGWLRAGYPPNAPQHGHIALLALYSADLLLLASFGCTPHVQAQTIFSEPDDHHRGH